MKYIFLALQFLISVCLYAQPYIWPTETAVKNKLEWWQDQKFGLMMHWGTYSQWGIVESWSLCSEDQPWCSRGGAPYELYKQQYEALATTFNPVNFDPELYANKAKEAGMRYVVFTTKHHDGFCMFDTKYTDYRITGPRSAFKSHPRSDIAGQIFQSFRNKGMGIGAYFSKPDWHHPDFWAPEWATPNRCNNYDTGKYPERWQRFKDFTYNQIEELMTKYGQVDILWLDGGWVRPDSTITDEVKSWGYQIPTWSQDIDMSRISKMARQHQPGLLVVDRSVHGVHENYRTPEQQVPDKTLDYPWETCMTMSNSWSWVKDPVYKSTETLIHLLIDIVAKGGNFLLNIGPGPDGKLDSVAISRLEEIGAWMKINHPAIYSSRPLPPYKLGNICYTQDKSNKTGYAIYLAQNETLNPPSVWMLETIHLKKGAKVILLETGEALKWNSTPSGTQIEISKKVLPKIKSKHAWTIKFDM